MTQPGESSAAVVEIGRIVKAHGLSGEVGVKLHWGQSELVFDLAEAIIGGKPRVIESVRPTAKGVLVKLEGVDDRTAAEALVGQTVLVPRDLLPEPEPGEYYLSDLIGARVISPAGEVGEIVEVRVHPSVDTAVVRDADGRTRELPLVEAWLDEVDLEARLVRISSEDALVD